ncbi:MAG: hypothetical protein R3B93_08235 [Bacteroidia bacterium]
MDFTKKVFLLIFALISLFHFAAFSQNRISGIQKKDLLPGLTQNNIEKVVQENGVKKFYLKEGATVDIKSLTQNYDYKNTKEGVVFTRKANRPAGDNSLWVNIVVDCACISLDDDYCEGFVVFPGEFTCLHSNDCPCVKYYYTK